MIEYKRYLNFKPEAIREDLERQGYKPIKDTDEPNFVYEPHSHPETNIIAVITGEMEVTVAEENGTLRAGDLVTFPSGVVHSSKIGPQGCSYFWIQNKTKNSKEK